jgi:hypothetical protein
LRRGSAAERGQVRKSSSSLGLANFLLCSLQLYGPRVFALWLSEALKS